MDTATKIRTAMDEAGISRVELAAEMTRCGVPTSDAAVGAWLCGRNEPKTAAALAMARVLGTTVEEMFG